MSPAETLYLKAGKGGEEGVLSLVILVMNTSKESLSNNFRYCRIRPFKSELSKQGHNLK